MIEAPLGLTLTEAIDLRGYLLQAAIDGQAVLERTDEFGDRYRFDFEVVTDSGRAMVRSAWIIRG